VLTVAASYSMPTWAQEPARSTDAASTSAPSTTESQRAAEVDHENTLGLPFLKNIVQDQRVIWSSPGHLRLRDASWLVPLGGLTAGLLVTDSDVSRHLSNARNRLDTSRKLSDFGAASLIGAAGGLYFWGKATQDDRKRETGLLSGEALINGLAFSQTIKFSTGRERPREDNARGSFGQGGTSFPSDHSVAAWSVASVIAHEYPGPLTKLFAYGLASAVSASRVTAKEHFPSDVLVGSAIGWFVGEHVYRAHHNPDLGGGTWNTFAETFEGESGRKPQNMGSPYVPLDSWVYPALERLAALGYVQTAFLGMRPWTRLECARLVDEAADRFRAAEADPQEPTRLYQALEKEFTGDLALLGGGSNRTLRPESVYTRFTGIAGKPLTDGYHFGQTIINDYGRPYAEGFNDVSGLSGWASEGPFTFYLRGEYQYAPSGPALPQQARAEIARVDFLPTPPALAVSSVSRFRLVEAYAAMNLENWQVSFGKQSLWWGPGEGGSMMWTDNAEPVNMLRITRVSPSKLPSIFGLMGPIRTEFFIGQLGGYQFIFHQPPLGLIGQSGVPLADQPMINGAKMSFKPTPNLEFGFERTTIFGGAGYPVTWHSFLRSMFSLTDTVAGAPNKPGKRLSGFDMTYRFPGLRNWVTFYTDSLAYDEFTPVAYFDRSANSAGFYFARLPKLPKFDLRLEGVYTDNPISSSTSGNLCCGFYYSNGTWRSGYRNQGNLIASWVGRDGQGFQGWLGRSLGAQGRLEFMFRHQKVSGQFISGGGTVNDGGGRANFWLRPDLSVTAGVQYEQWDFPVLASAARSNLTTSFQFTFWPHGGK
jgi:capsule assembly protein Wzi/PAP2 superfamily protein